jgi:ATP:ADP antiporter, AAA family
MQTSIRPQATYGVWIMALFLGLLIGANTLIKILRDSVFLGHHSASELPYLYILVALIAGVIIATYTRYTAKISIIRLILATNAVIFLNIVFFSILLTYFDSNWSHYAFYIWSAIATVIAVAQAWTLANHIFTQEEAKQSFGLIAAGGTVGGVAASFGAQWSIHLSVESNHMLWVVGGIYILASVLVVLARSLLKAFEEESRETERSETGRESGIGEILSGSGYLKTIALIILVSVIVSTLIDFSFKTSAKQAYSTTRELAGFFSSYYGWLNAATLFVQVLLTGKTLSKLGLAPSLHITPGALLTGSVAMMIWPGLPTAMLTRMADAILRNSIHRSGMEIVYMGIPANVVKAAKTFLDVVVERIGDASAGFVILLFSLLSAERYIAYVHFICVGLIISWLALNRLLQARYSEAFRKGLVSHEASPRRTWLESN